MIGDTSGMAKKLTFGYHTVTHTLSLSYIIIYYHTMFALSLLQLMTWNQGMKPWNPRCWVYWCPVDVGIPWTARLFNILWSDPIEDGAHADPNTFGLSAVALLGWCCYMLLHSLLVRTFKTLNKWCWFNVDSGDSWSLQDFRRNIWQGMTSDWCRSRFSSLLLAEVPLAKWQGIGGAGNSNRMKLHSYKLPPLPVQLAGCRHVATFTLPENLKLCQRI